MSYTVRAIVQYLNSNPQESKKSDDAQAFVIGDIVFTILLATTATLSILAAGGENLAFFNILEEIPLPANIAMLSIAGAFILADLVTFTVKKSPPDSNPVQAPTPEEVNPANDLNTSVSSSSEEEPEKTNNNLHTSHSTSAAPPDAGENPDLPPLPTGTGSVQGDRITDGTGALPRPPQSDGNSSEAPPNLPPMPTVQNAVKGDHIEGGTGALPPPPKMGEQEKQTIAQAVVKQQETKAKLKAKVTATMEANYANPFNRFRIKEIVKDFIDYFKEKKDSPVEPSNKDDLLDARSMFTDVDEDLFKQLPEAFQNWCFILRVYMYSGKLPDEYNPISCVHTYNEKPVYDPDEPEPIKQARAKEVATALEKFFKDISSELDQAYNLQNSENLKAKLEYDEQQRIEKTKQQLASQKEIFDKARMYDRFDLTQLDLANLSPAAKKQILEINPKFNFDSLGSDLKVLKEMLAEIKEDEAYTKLNQLEALSKKIQQLVWEMDQALLQAHLTSDFENLFLSAKEIALKEQSKACMDEAEVMIETGKNSKGHATLTKYVITKFDLTKFDDKDRQALASTVNLVTFEEKINRIRALGAKTTLFTDQEKQEVKQLGISLRTSTREIARRTSFEKFSSAFLERR